MISPVALLAKNDPQYQNAFGMMQFLISRSPMPGVSWSCPAGRCRLI